MSTRALALLLCLGLAGKALAADPPSTSPSTSPSASASASSSSAGLSAKPVKIKPKKSSNSDGSQSAGSLIAPDPDLIDTPTSAVLDYGGYNSRSRFYSQGGILEYVSFGVYQGLNLGGSLNIDGIVGSNQSVRVRAPNVQVKWRFYDGDHELPSLAVGFDGQGYDYNSTSQRYNERQRGFFLVGTEELGLPGLQVHPSINISDTDTNSIYGALPFSYNIKDKVLLMMEWDNISNFYDSRINMGLRVYVTSHFDVDFAVREIGAGGAFSNGDSRGPERIVQLKYSANF